MRTSRGNIVKFLAKDGFDLERSSSNVFEANTVTTNMGNGFALDVLSNANVFFQNTMKNNIKSGASLDDSSNNLFISNTITGNAVNGLKFGAGPVVAGLSGTGAGSHMNIGMLNTLCGNTQGEFKNGAKSKDNSITLSIPKADLTSELVVPRP